jgi:UDP-glucuronate decarboxylase
MSALTDKRVLVTGGAGFIGSFLCQRLVDAGNEVPCVDNLFTGRRRSVAPLLQEPSFELVRHDINRPLYVEVEQIYNLACPASPIERRPVVTKAEELLDWRPKIGLDEGLARTVEYFDRYLRKRAT